MNNMTMIRSDSEGSFSSFSSSPSLLYAVVLDVSLRSEVIQVVLGCCGLPVEQEGDPESAVTLCLGVRTQDPAPRCAADGGTAPAVAKLTLVQR